MIEIQPDPTVTGKLFDIASDAIPTAMIAQASGLRQGDFVHTFGDAHLYVAHLEQATTQRVREPRPLPTLRRNPDVCLPFDFTYEDIAIEGYAPHPAIKEQATV